MPSRILAEIARKTGGKLINQTINRIVPGTARGGKTAKGGGLLAGIAGAAAVRIATRSIPGALAVGGALLAKTLYDRRREAKGQPPGKGAGKDRSPP